MGVDRRRRDRNRRHAAQLLLVLAALSPAPSASAQDTNAMKVEPLALDNAWVRVTRDEAACAAAAKGRCEHRVVVAMGTVDLESGNEKRRLRRGDVAVFGPLQSYAVKPGGQFYEVAIKPGHPAVKAPPLLIPAKSNRVLFDTAKFLVYEERLGVGQVNERHSHSQRVEIRINTGPVLHQWVWSSSAVAESEPSPVSWREPITHTVRNVGTQPLRNIVVELKPAD